MKTIDFTLQPEIRFAGERHKAPSLLFMVRAYYEKHFDSEDVDELITKYIKSLQKHHKDNQ